MVSVRSCSSIATYLLTLASAWHLCSGTPNPSLWGKNINFRGKTCVWQLDQKCVVPALEELSVCVHLHLDIETPAWTAFVYKARGQPTPELGLTGKQKLLKAWLFGESFEVGTHLTLKEWHSICLTWSGTLHRLRVFVNGSQCLEADDTTLSQRLAQNGTLTLGLSHNLNSAGNVTVESGTHFVGNISLFRMWNREKTMEELKEDICTDGDVVSWDTRDWKYTNCPPEPNNHLTCAWSLYKIQMRTTFVPQHHHYMSPVLLEKITRQWLTSVFPHNITVNELSVLPLSLYKVGSNEAYLQDNQQVQGKRNFSNSTTDSFINVVVVSVLPEADVGVIQVHISDLLRPNFTFDLFTLIADASTLSIKPMAVPSPTTTAAPTTLPTTTHSESSAEPTLVQTSKSTQELNYTRPMDYKDTFFRVRLSLNMTGDAQQPMDTINKWLQVKLTPETMDFLNLKILEDSISASKKEETHGLEMIPRLSRKGYKCGFHVQAFGTRNVTETTELLYKLLTSENESDSIIIQALPSEITHIEPGICPEDITKGIYGEYIWAPGEPEETLSIGCQKNPSMKGYRLCKLDPETERATWKHPDFRNCNPVFTLSDLEDIVVTANNSADVVDMVGDLVNEELGSDGSLTGEELSTVVQKLTEVVGVGTVTQVLGSQIIGIVGDLLESDTVLSVMSNSILNLTDRIGENMLFTEDLVSVAVPSLAISMVNVDSDQFQGLTFGVSSFSTGHAPEIFVNQSFVSDPFDGALASISLPPAIRTTLLQQNGIRRRVQFQFYGQQELFEDRKSNLTLNTYVVSASVRDSVISDLSEPVVVTLRHLKPKQANDMVLCVFWDIQKNNGQGGWSSQGCETEGSSTHRTSCRCNHLTHFGVLLDVSRTPISEKDSRILSLISYIGCGVSSIFLGISLLTYTAFGKLRKDYPSKILINLSAALLGLNMTFLLDSWLSSFNSYGLCISTAATLHYFMLASFIWMGLEAVHMYLALVKVFNIYVPSYILKFCSLGWGIPLVVVSLVLAIDMDAYGSAVPMESTDLLQDSEQFCWLQSDVVFYVTVLAFVVLVMMMNITVFIVVLVQIRNMRTNKPNRNRGTMMQDLRAAISLTFLLGLSWPIAFFALGSAKVPLLYFFSFLNSLQGFFIFVFHCLMKENVRKQWRIHLCCGPFRLSEYSDWSRSVTLGEKPRKIQLVNSPSLRSEDTSSSRKISDSSIGSTTVNH